MPRFHIAALLAPLALVAATAAPAQDIAAFEQAEQALVEAWEQLPLSLRNPTLVSAPVDGFGLQTPRENAVYAPGDAIVAYAEPIGYGYQANPDGTYSFGLLVDLVLRDASGAVVGGQEAFQRSVLTSHARNREFFITLTLNVTGAPAGDYTVDYIVHDLVSQEVATVSFPFSIAAR